MSAPTWIKASDQLPDDDQTVLVVMDDGEVWTGYLDGGEWRYVSGEPITFARITHWMDFPEPPAETSSTPIADAVRARVRAGLCDCFYGLEIDEEKHKALYWAIVRNRLSANYTYADVELMNYSVRHGNLDKRRLNGAKKVAV